MNVKVGRFSTMLPLLVPYTRTVRRPPICKCIDGHANEPLRIGFQKIDRAHKCVLIYISSHTFLCILPYKDICISNHMRIQHCKILYFKVLYLLPVSYLLWVYTVECLMRVSICQAISTYLFITFVRMCEHFFLHFFHFVSFFFRLHERHVVRLQEGREMFRMSLGRANVCCLLV